MPLLWDTTKKTLDDCGKATGYAWNALKKSALG